MNKLIQVIKICSRCKQLLGVGSFYKNNRAKDGLQYICKECDKESVRAYHKTTKGKEVQLATYRRMRVKYPEKYKARYIVKGAVSSGKLVKEPCEVCGALKVEAHHRDYNKSLDVNWLCPRHHRELHKEEVC